MTPAELKSFAVSVLRRASYRTRARSSCMKVARIARNTYVCAQCGGKFPRRGVAVDHIAPVVPVSGWDGFDGFIGRLFCDEAGLQVLCREVCHAAKSKAENAQRREAKKASLNGKNT